MDEDNLKRALETIKIKVGATAATIVSNPEFNRIKLKQILKLLDRTRFDQFNETDHRNTVVAIHQLLALTTCQIFKDIIPSYRIRSEYTDDSIKKRKQTMELREYEKFLCSIYKTYLQRLERMLDCLKKVSASNFYKSLIKTTRDDRLLLAKTALICYGDLLVEHPHFNFRDQVLKKLVYFAAQSKYPECCYIATERLSRLLSHDKLGEVSVETTRLICELVKTRKLSLAPNVFKLLLNLRLIDVKLADSEIKEQKKAQKKKEEMMGKMLSRREIKRNKKMKKLKSELLETEAIHTVDQKVGYHKLILKRLFVAYFRILKYHEELDCEVTETHKLMKILPPVLDGISKFAHLIDVDIFNDIFVLIRRLLQNKVLDTNSLIHCMKTVFVLQNEMSTIDLDSFYKQFYILVANLHPNRITRSEFASLVNCIELMFIKRAKKISQQRYSAFIRRFLIVALNCPSEYSVDLITIVRTMLSNRPSQLALLDSSNCGSGLYDIEIDDPDLSHAEASVCWELHLLLKHYEQAISQNAALLLKDQQATNKKFL